MSNLSKWRLWVGFGLLILAVLTDSALWLLSVLMDGVMIGGGIYFIWTYVTKRDASDKQKEEFKV